MPAIFGEPEFSLLADPPVFGEEIRPGSSQALCGGCSFGPVVQVERADLGIAGVLIGQEGNLAAGFRPGKVAGI